MKIYICEYNLCGKIIVNNFSLNLWQTRLSSFFSNLMPTNLRLCIGAVSYLLLDPLGLESIAWNKH